MHDDDIRKAMNLDGAPNEDEEREKWLNSPGRDMDLIEASASELLKLALEVETPFFKSQILQLAADAYKIVNLGAQAFGHECGPDCMDEEDEDED